MEVKFVGVLAQKKKFPGKIIFSYRCERNLFCTSVLWSELYIISTFQHFGKDQHVSFFTIVYCSAFNRHMVPCFSYKGVDVFEYIHTTYMWCAESLVGGGVRILLGTLMMFVCVDFLQDQININIALKSTSIRRFPRFLFVPALVCG